MAISRYTKDSRMRAGTMLSTAQATLTIRNAMKNGVVVPVQVMRTSGFNRLDNLAGEIYEDARYWWVLAAASDVGWALQVPPGTIINVLDINDVKRLVG